MYFQWLQYLDFSLMLIKIDTFCKINQILGFTTLEYQK